MYKFAKLDLFMIKPYLKRMLIILFLVSVPLLVVTGEQYIMSFLTVFYGVIMVSYPFVLSERNNVDNFYGTLSINKRDIVNGRYVFSLGVLIIFSAISSVCIILSSMILQENFDIHQAILMLSLAFFLALVLTSIELPIYFKFGYSKGKIFSYMPFILIGIGVPLIVKIIGDDAGSSLKLFETYVENNSTIFSIIIILGALIVFVISNIVSQKLYKK